MENQAFRISAVVLASGMSKRMGTVKQLLEIDGQPMLEGVIRKALPLPFVHIYCVVGYQHEEITKRIAIADPRFEWRYNARYREGQSEALKCAVSAAEHDHGIVVFLGDQPLIEPGTIHLVLEHALEKLSTAGTQSLVIRPSFSGKPGHPVFFSRGCFPSFERLKGDEGGKGIISEADSRHVIPVQDAGILFDVDTTEDYEYVLKARWGGR